MKKLQLQSNKIICVIGLLMLMCSKIKAQQQWVNFRDSLTNCWVTSIHLLGDNLFVIRGANKIFMDTMSIDILDKNTGLVKKSNVNFGLGADLVNTLTFNKYDSCYYFTYGSEDSIIDTLDDHYRKWIAKANKNGDILFTKRISDKYYTFLGAYIVPNDSNTLWICGTNTFVGQAANNVAYFKLYKIDTSGSILWQDSFPAPPDEFMSNMINDDAGNLYMCGVDYVGDFLDNNYKFLVKKVNKNGTLILNKYFPNPLNCSWPYLVKLPNNNMVLINIQNDSVTANQYNDLGPLIRMQFLDSNLIVYKTTLTRCDGLNSYYTMQLTNKGNIVFVGSKFTNKTYKLSPWFAILDTNGNVLCNKTYTIRGTTAMYFACITEDAEGNFYIGGTIGADSAHTQDGLVIKLDSNGCLDNNYCYPLGFKEVVPEPIAQLNVYPNPASNAITIALNIENLYGGVLSIYNASGQLVHNSNALKSFQTIAASTWPKGIYFIRYTMGIQILMSKFIKE
jgi:hypothetical protein